MRPLIAALLVAACTALNPAYDEPSSAPSGGPGDPPTGGPAGSAPATDPATSQASDTAGATADIPTTSVGETGPGPTTGSVATDPTLATTTLTTGPDPATDPTAADPCADVTCGECSECTDGQCAPRRYGHACVDAPGTPCHERVYGLTNGTCYKYAFFPPICDGAGQCVHDCQAQGDPIVACSEVCVSPSHNCNQGELVTGVSPATVCALNVETDGCKHACGFENQKPVWYPYACDGAGACAPEFGMAVGDCFPGHCDVMAGCLLTCMGPQDCAQGAQCVDDVCKP